MIRTIIISFNIWILYLTKVISQYLDEPIDYKNVEIVPDTTLDPNIVLSNEEEIDPSTIHDLSMDKVERYFTQYNDFFGFINQDNHNSEKFHDNFEENIKRIILMNRLLKGVQFRINEYTRLSLEEFTDMYTGFNSVYLDDFEANLYVKTKEPPETVFWIEAGGDVQKFQDGRCNDSYVFSAMSTIEHQCERKYGVVPAALSAQQGFSCDPHGNCKDGGLPHNVMIGLKNAGNVSATFYTNDYFQEYVQKGPCVSPAPVLRILSVKRLRVNNEDDLAAAVSELGPFATAIYVSQTVKNYHAGILDPFDCDKEPNHAVVLVGYGVDNKVPFWLVKISWGALWGEHGLLRLIRGKGACGIGNYLATVDVELLKLPHYPVNRRGVRNRLKYISKNKVGLASTFGKGQPAPQLRAHFDTKYKISRRNSTFFVAKTTPVTESTPVRATNMTQKSAIFRETMTEIKNSLLEKDKAGNKSDKSNYNISTSTNNEIGLKLQTQAKNPPIPDLQNLTKSDQIGSENSLPKQIEPSKVHSQVNTSKNTKKYTELPTTISNKRSRYSGSGSSSSDEVIFDLGDKFSSDDSTSDSSKSEEKPKNLRRLKPEVFVTADSFF